MLPLSRPPLKFRTATTSAMFILAFVAVSGWASVTSLYLRSEAGDGIGNGQLYYFTSSNATFSAVTNRDRGISISLFPSGGFWFLDFSAPDDALLEVGSYTGATRWPFQSTTQPGLSISGDGRGCN